MIDEMVYKGDTSPSFEEKAKLENQLVSQDFRLQTSNLRSPGIVPKNQFYTFRQ